MINQKDGMKKPNFILLAVIGLLAVILISPEFFRAWEWNGQELVKLNTPADLNTSDFFQPVPLSTNLNCLDLVNETVMIHQCGEESRTTNWVSPADWQVKEVVRGDLNRDGVEDFGLLVWRPFKPWPIDKFLPTAGRIATFQNIQGLSCHFILVGWDGEKYRELWAGSALVDPISQLKIVDIDKDGYDELIAIEGKYNSSESGNLTIWKWQGFGFTLMERVEGVFSRFFLARYGDRLVVLTD
jgi:hypothetical protein